jgi:hypothetical protein
MKKNSLVGLFLCIVLASCVTQSVIPPNIPSKIAASQSDLAPTFPITATWIVVDFSAQHPLIIKEKKLALYSYDKQVIDNGISLSAEEVNPQCHKAEKGNGTRAPMSVKFTFRNLTSNPLTISDRFAFHPSVPSGYIGADFTTVFFLDSGERLYTSGDDFDDYSPGPMSFMDIPPNGTYIVTLDVMFPYQIGIGDGPLYYLTPGYYFVKFIYWTAQVERVSDLEGPISWNARAVSSNPIVVCIE